MNKNTLRPSSAQHRESMQSYMQTGEHRFNYQPFEGLEDRYRFTPTIWDGVIRDYNLRDLGI